MRQEKQEESNFMARPGQDLIMAGLAGLAGTREIACLHKEKLDRRFSPVFLEEQLSGQEEEEKAFGQVVCGGAARPVLEREISAWEAVGEGGVLAALWNLSGVFNAGIEFDLRRIPIRQATVEICELYGLNPYRLRSGGGFVAAADNGGRAVRALEAAGIPAAVIGSVIPGTARRMSHGGESAGFLERPQPDEYDKICGDERQT